VHSQHDNAHVHSQHDNAHVHSHTHTRARAQVGQLLPMVLRGVAVHHSGLLPVLKELVEILFQVRTVIEPNEPQ
jgi:ATP-dependent RNA helicase DOB1